NMQHYYGSENEQLTLSKIATVRTVHYGDMDAQNARIEKLNEDVPREYIAYTNYPTSVFTAANDYNKIHPTQKPLKLMEHIVKLYTNENDTILDFTMGSGSTGVAAVLNNRNFIGIELHIPYFITCEFRL
ncbi:MAG: DNA methyltransferase, partial [Cellulosilyticaceae bacterium]